MADSTVSLVVLGAAIVLFVWNRLPAALVAVLTALALAAAGVVSGAQVLAGLGDPVVLFIATLFVLSEGLEATGVTAWAGHQVVEHAGTGRVRVVVGIMTMDELKARADALEKRGRALE